jgi:hypothetical protein
MYTAKIYYYYYYQYSIAILFLIFVCFVFVYLYCFCVVFVFLCWLFNWHLRLSLHVNFFFNGSTAPRGPRPPHFFEALRSHFLGTPQSVGLLWTRDQLVAETST